jgi:hypothetical protein
LSFTRQLADSSKLTQNMRQQSLLFGVVLCVVAIGGDLSALAQDRAEQDALVGFLLQGARSSRESFAFLQAKLRITNASARTERDAIEGRWLPDPAPVDCEVFWAFHGDNFRRDDVYSPEVIKQHETKEGSLLTRSYTSRFAVWNSSLEMSYDPDPPGQMFFVGQKGERNLEGWNPFNVAMVLPPDQRAQLLTGKHNGRVSYLGERELEGRSLAILEFTYPYAQGHAQIDDYWIDPDHGYYPVRIDTYYDTKDEVAMVTVVKEFLEVDGPRWLPKSATYVNLRVRKDGIASRVIEYRLREVNVDVPPNPEVFQLSVPPDTRGHNRITNQRLTCPSGRVRLTAFRSDGTLREDQGDLAAFRSAMQSPVDPKQSLGAFAGESTVPSWPFIGRNGSASRVWIVVALAAGVAALAVALAVKRLMKR